LPANRQKTGKSKRRKAAPRDRHRSRRAAKQSRDSPGEEIDELRKQDAARASAAMILPEEEKDEAHCGACSSTGAMTCCTHQQSLSACAGAVIYPRKLVPSDDQKSTSRPALKVVDRKRCTC